MIRYSGVVVYTDGRRERFESSLVAGRAWEAYAVRHDLPINATPETITRFPVHTWMTVIAHAALGEALGVDAWERDVIGIEDWQADDSNPPTLPAPSADLLSNSLSSSDGQ